MFDFESEFKRVTAAYLAQITIDTPVSVRSPSASLTGWPVDKPVTQCWECAAPLEAPATGPYNYCPACRAEQRLEARQIEAEERRPLPENDQ